MIKINQALGYMSQAFMSAEQSHANDLKVGALLIRPMEDGRHIPLSNGYNGTEPGECNSCEGSDGESFGPDVVIHAEINSFNKLKEGEADGATIFVTRSPCMSCCTREDIPNIVTSGIKTVYYCEEHRDESPLEYLRSKGIDVIHIPKSDVLDYVKIVAERLTKQKFN
jgi:dCMP deaminase